LVSIAREQYGNGNCWVYIYLANNKIVNPNVLRSGKTVHVPELTDEEKAISASDSKRLFNENKR
jgi:nucleoid-associated protein YgaU